MLIGEICHDCFESTSEGKVTTIKEAAQNWVEIKPEDSFEGIKDLKEEIRKNPKKALNYYYLAKGFMLNVPIRAMDSIQYIEDLLRKSLKLRPGLWAPKIFLGELLFKVARYEEAEKYLREAVEMKPESVSIKEYLAGCIEANSKAIGLKEKKLSEKDLLCLFENDLRKFIKKVLEENFKDDWWRKGIPTKTRSSCASRREEGLEEEKDIDLILFANFYDYKEILNQNKGLFSQYLDVKEWCSKLNGLEPIRNVVAHNRNLDSAFEKIKDCYDELQKIVERLGKC